MFGESPRSIYHSQTFARLGKFVVTLIVLTFMATHQAHASATRVAVIGDSLAVELWKGLHQIGKARPDLKVVKRTKVATGLIRRDVFNWNRRIRKIAADKKFDIAVVVMGGNDRQSVWVNKRRLRRGTKAWRREYTRRADAFMKALKKAGKPVFWVGLPVVRSARMSRDYRTLNRIFKQLSKKHGFKYLDSWQVFSDGKGRYTAFGRDAKGTRRPMREKDGLHFSSYGQRKFGRFVYSKIKSTISAVQ